MPGISGHLCDTGYLHQLVLSRLLSLDCHSSFLLLPHNGLPSSTGCCQTHAPLSHRSLGVAPVRCCASRGHQPFGLCTLCCLELVFCERHWLRTEWSENEPSGDYHYSFRRKAMGDFNVCHSDCALYPHISTCCKGRSCVLFTVS